MAGVAYAGLVLTMGLTPVPVSKVMIEKSPNACTVEHHLAGRSTSARAVANLRLRTEDYGPSKPNGFRPVAYGQGRHDIYLETRFMRSSDSLESCVKAHRSCVPNFFQSDTVSLYCIAMDDSGKPAKLHVVREP